MSCLHWVLAGRVPAFTVAAGDAVVLAADGVYHLASPETTSAWSELAMVYALQADVEARGVSVPEAVKLLSDNEAFNLLEAYQAMLSWS